MVWMPGIVSCWEYPLWYDPLRFILSFPVCCPLLSASLKSSYATGNFGFFGFSWKTKKPKNQNCTDHVCPRWVPQRSSHGLCPPQNVQFWVFGFSPQNGTNHVCPDRFPRDHPMVCAILGFWVLYINGHPPWNISSVWRHVWRSVLGEVPPGHVVIHDNLTNRVALPTMRHSSFWPISFRR